MGLFSIVQEKVADGADFVKKTGEAAIDTATEAGKAVVETAKDVAVATYDGAKEAAFWTKNKAIEAGEWAADKAVAAGTRVKNMAVAGTKKAIAIGKKTYEVGKKALEALKEGAKTAGNFTVDELAGAVAILISAAATSNKPVEICLQGLLEYFNPTEPSPQELEKAKQADGKYLGPGCQPTEKPPAHGVLPEGCEDCEDCKSGKFPKILYVNGINTQMYKEADPKKAGSKPEGACVTIQEIANTRCAEVIGIYNATKGITTDLLDCKNNIDRAGREPAAHKQAQYLVDSLSKDPPEPVTIYAHSQGGLITQEGLAEAQKQILDKELKDVETENKHRREQGLPPYDDASMEQMAAQRTEARMSQVTVYSFGTAVYDWPPVGAHLHQLTNMSDPVPKVIKTVQLNRGKIADEAARKAANEKPANHLDESKIFVQPFLNPIDAHSMDNVYLPKLEEIHPTPKQPNGKCC